MQTNLQHLSRISRTPAFLAVEGIFAFAIGLFWVWSSIDHDVSEIDESIVPVPNKVLDRSEIRTQDSAALDTTTVSERANVRSTETTRPTGDTKRPLEVKDVAKSEPKEKHTGSPLRPTPNRSKPAPKAGSWLVSMGRVAYLRCDGLKKKNGPFPCPRDRKLENAVWSSLKNLRTCTNISSQNAGMNELRLEFTDTSTPPKSSLRTVARAKGVAKATGDGQTKRTQAGKAIQKCIDPTIKQVRTWLRAERMVVSFHFNLKRVVAE